MVLLLGSVVFTAVMENPGLFGYSHDCGAEEESLRSLSEGRASEPHGPDDVLKDMNMKVKK